MPEEKVTFPSINDVPAQTWENLSKKAIYFGHQSVGFNIMEGVQDIIKTHPAVHLSVVETTDAATVGPGVFAHSKVGRNMQPEVKIADFRKFLGEGVGQKADFAALKFCYVDIDRNSDVRGLFKAYVEAIESIKKQYPALTIIHFTLPLTVSKTTWKTRIKKLIGKTDLWEYADNIKRNEYNSLLLEKYTGKELILDIAQIESTRPDGTRQAFSLKGLTYYSMAPEYTSDGGHLNENGRKKVAEQLLISLANLNGSPIKN